jgi:hypothetical protein
MFPQEGKPMLKRILVNHILGSTLKSLKGKKRWLAILVLVVAYAVEALGLDLGVSLDGFVADVIDTLQTAES